jgi:hypothetical protein
MTNSLRACTTVLVLGGIAALPARVQDAAAHKAWMDDAGDLQEELAEQLRAESADKAADAALKLEKILEQTQTYWAARHADDIVAIARESRALATEVATSAKASRFSAAADANKKLNTRCNACHDLHPEKR